MDYLEYMLEDISQLLPEYDSDLSFYTEGLLDEEDAFLRVLFRYFDLGKLPGVEAGMVYANVAAALLHRNPKQIVKSSGGAKPYGDKSMNMSSDEKNEVLGVLYTSLSRVLARRQVIDNSTEDGEKKEKKKKDPNAPKGAKRGKFDVEYITYNYFSTNSHTIFYSLCLLSGEKHSGV